MSRFATGLVLGCAVLATGFVRQGTQDGTPLEWQTRCPLLELGRLDVRGPTADELHAVFAHAFDAWASDGCTPLPFALGEPVDATDLTVFDGRNVIVTRGADYCDGEAHADEQICLNPDTLAITTLYYVDAPGDARNGDILEVDMEINLLHPFSMDGAPDTFDLTTAVTHEIGHVLGLGHTCSSAPGARLIDPSGHEIPACSSSAADDGRTATMYPWAGPAEIDRRNPRSDERAAMCLLYRNRSPRCANGELSAGCAAGRDADGALRVVFAGLLVILVGMHRARRTRHA